MTIPLALLFFLFMGMIHAMPSRDAASRVREDSIRVPLPRLVEKPKQKYKETSVYARRMASSAFPVQLQVKGSSLLIVSDCAQLLPIYTQGGAFYMAMRLNKGKNWLGGLPRGRYIINHRSISIP